MNIKQSKEITVFPFKNDEEQVLDQLFHSFLQKYFNITTISNLNEH